MRQWSHNIVIERTDFFETKRSMAMAISAVLQKKAMLFAVLDGEYAHKEFFFRQRPQTGKLLLLPPTLTQEPSKHVCYMVTRTREKDPVALPDLFKCLEVLRDKLLSLEIFLAIGDSMFHLITFEAGADLGEAAKVSYSGQRIAEIYRYCSFAFSRQREVIILNIGTNDLLKRFDLKYPRGPLTVEDCLQSLVAFIEWAFSFYRPRVIMVCTLIPVPKDDGFHRDAEVFNAYIYAYARSHVRVVVLETALKLRDLIKKRDWSQIYHADRTHLDKQRGAYLLSDLINQALDYYAMDNPGIVSSKILID